MHKGLTAGVFLAVVTLAGCGSGVGEAPPAAGGDSSAAQPTETAPARTAPAKSLALPTKCSVVTEEQAKQLGADQPPRDLESNGKAGCDYDLGVSGAGFQVFVAADQERTLKQFVTQRRSQAKEFDLVGYPAAKVGIGATNCMVAVDVADQGSLFINTLVSSGNPEPCELSKKFAEAAIQNLPNA